MMNDTNNGADGDTPGDAPRKPDLKPVSPSLKSAMRRARIEDAERSDVLAELRGAEIARLEMLAEALEPVYAQLPDDVDIFDAGVAPGARPRLFVDMIGFVEMGEDKRTYRFVQDTRHGRITVAESERAEKMVEAVTDYVARRMLERERALVSDRTVEDAARAYIAGKHGSGTDAADRNRAAPPAVQEHAAAKAAPQPGPAPRRRLGWLWDGIEFLALFIGFIVLLVGLAGAVYFLWTLGETWWVAKFFKAG